MTTWDEWAARSDTTKVFLVETAAVRLADGATVQLYLSNHPYQTPDKQFLPCVSGLPRLTRQANDTLSPNHIPTWGELEILLEPDCRPDAGCSVSWDELLSEAWNLRGQILTIKIGDPSFAYGDFRTIFDGRVGKYNNDGIKLILAIYDKSQDFSQKIPDYSLPESPLVAEDSWDQAVPVVLGIVKNYKPVLITLANPGSYPLKYALACHVIQGVDQVYVGNYPYGYIWTQKDIFPAARKAEGSALLTTSGPYTGALMRGEWQLEIDDITTPNEIGESGPSIGLARFSWKLNGVVQGQGLLTWKLAYDPTTLAKPLSLGAGTMTVAGDYTGEVKYPYRLKISTDGYVGTAKFRYSRDNGVIWSDEVLIAGTDPIPFDKGLTAAFVGPAGSLGPTTKIPVGASPGTASFGGAYDATAHRQYRAQILTGGDVGVATFKWSDDGGASWSDPVVTGVDIALSHSVTISFYGISPEPEPPVDDFDVGDEWNCQVPSFIVDDYWSWGFKEIPIPLGDGVSVQFQPNSSFSQPVYPVRTWPFNSGAVAISGAFSGGAAASYQLIITGTNLFKWTDNGVTWHEDVPFAGSPVYLSNGLSATFTGVFGSGDQFNFTALPRGGEDFVLWDEFTFIVGSTLGFWEFSDPKNITVDVRGLVSPLLGFTTNIAEIIQAILMVWRGWEPADFDQEALTAFAAAVPYMAGKLVDSPTEISSVIDDLLTGIPALYSIRRDGRFFLNKLAPVPSEATPRLLLQDFELLKRPESEDCSDNLYRRVYLNYDRNCSSEKSPSAPTQERLEWLKREYRQVSDRDDSILIDYPWAQDLGPLNTALVTRTDAQALAGDNLTLYKVKHGNLKAVTKIRPFVCDLGDYIELLGQKRLLLGLEEDYTAAEATLTLWR